MTNQCPPGSLETKQQRVVFPDSTNDQGHLFGGIALKWMDEIAYLTATRYTQQTFVTVRVEKVRFLLPVRMGSWVEVIGRIRSRGHVKITIGVEIWKHDPQEEMRKKAVEGLFILAPVDDTGTPETLKK